MKKEIFCVVLLFLTVSGLHAASQTQIAKQIKAPKASRENAPAKPQNPNTGKLDWPLLTGPLIVPNGTVTPVGHYYIQNYASFENYTGLYNANWKSSSTPNLFSFNPQSIIFVGLTDWMDIYVAPQALVNTHKGASAARFGDLPVGLDIQAVAMDTGKWYPGVKLTIQESFPSGKFKNLNPNDFNADISGTGNYKTTLSVLLHNVYHIWKSQFLSLYAYAGYTMNSEAQVYGFNTYGGGNGTDGKVNGGHSIQGIFSFEYAFTVQWALALDTVYTHTNRLRFNGINGTNNDGTEAKVGLPSSELLAFAPAIEYNVDEHFGLIIGCYLSAIGRNSAIFRNGIAELAISY